MRKNNFNIFYDEQYGKCIEIYGEKDIFKGTNNIRELKERAYIWLLNGNEKFETITDRMDNKEIKFTRISAKEYVYGRNSQKLKAEFYMQKMRMAPSIDDLINNATITYYSPLTHKNNLFKFGYNNYQGKLIIDNNIFSYIVRIGKAMNDNIFYNISLEFIGQKNRTDSKVLETS